MKENKNIIIVIIILLIVGVIAKITILIIEKENELISPEEVVTDNQYTNIEYKEESAINEFDSENIIGFLTINKIDLRAKVKVGSDSETLKNYIGIIGTNTYDGNVSLAAHNRGYEKSYFARLNELELNDEIVYETNFFTRKYKVTDIKVIKETDLSVLENSNNNKLTLITCIKNKSTQRLCVVAEEIL